ncbi:MAG: excinuclease ABC subunit UvrC [Candidatus Omnitrophica bacterium]|nr:excinuclease ABC subunit UvrC [Candidatus Omnitrophota bacterium]
MDLVDKKKSDLKQKVQGLPLSSGVYLFMDISGRIIYVGKAKSLKNRVSSYFTRFLSDKTQALVSRIADIEYIVTPSEAQAQLLENALIKEKQPHYNISLKDDKSFPFIRISKEDFPLVSVCRRKDAKKDTGSFYGPYTSAQSLRQAVKTMRRIFGFRSCRVMPKKACLYLRLNLCQGPCEGMVSKQDYNEAIEQIRLFLSSRYEELLHKLTGKMREFSTQKRFEDAARVRDRINILSIFAQGRMHSTGLNELEDLKLLLKLKKTPERIEGFDISNISGKQATGSMVSFYNGLPDKDNYRRFRIKSRIDIDDYAMLREVMYRRYSRLKKEGKDMPDLILIDGGKGHLAAGKQVLNSLGLDIAVISIAKEKEQIFVSKQSSPLKSRIDSPAINLLRRIRDEAHRFALKYHHLLRRKKIIGK